VARMAGSMFVTGGAVGREAIVAMRALLVEAEWWRCQGFAPLNLRAFSVFVPVVRLVRLASTTGYPAVLPSGARRLDFI
jgi:hypothetical protein